MSRGLALFVKSLFGLSLFALGIFAGWYLAQNNYSVAETHPLSGNPNTFRSPATDQTHTSPNLSSSVPAENSTASTDNIPGMTSRGWVQYTRLNIGYQVTFPADWDNNLLSNGSASSGTKPYLSISVVDISTAPWGDSDCGQISPDSLARQQSSLEQSADGSDFTAGFRNTRSDMLVSKVFTNKEGVKFAYGIGACYNVDYTASTSLRYDAVTFWNNKRISIEVKEPPAQAVSVGHLYDVSKQIFSGTYPGASQDTYDTFLGILQGFTVEGESVRQN